jgi:glycyl-tRNA synthetase beta chain
VRVGTIAARIARQVEADKVIVARAAALAKCDLVSAMVGEFPELQGTMGRYYAHASDEPDAVAVAIGEQYLPRFAGDVLPTSAAGCSVAIADKLDTLCGIFALRKKPSGNRDPFGLRRNALGLVRIILERQLELDLPGLIESGLELQPQNAGEESAGLVYDFIIERMRGYVRERHSISTEVFESVLALRPASLLDFEQRLLAVSAFVVLDSAPSLAAANKRIANILRKSEHSSAEGINRALICESAEEALFVALTAAREEVQPLLLERHYDAALTRLAELRGPVDVFFDDVMVMAEEPDLRRNRLSLLAELRAQFLQVADISRLSIGKA